MRKTVFAFFVALLLVASTISAEAREIKRYFHQSFDVEKGSILHLRHGDGDVTITPWDKDVLDVEVRYRAEARTFGIGGEHEFKVEFKETGSVVHVIGKETSSSSIGFHHYRLHEYTYTIRAPEYLELTLDGDDGDVDIEDWQGKIECTLEDGDVDLRNIVSPETNIDLEDGDLRIDGLEGDLFVDGEDGDVVLRDAKTQQCRIRLEDGDLTIRRSEGEFEINVEDGDVDLDRVRAEMLEVSAQDGDVEVDLLKVDRIDLDIRVYDGDVTVNLEPGTSAAFSIDTQDGRIRTDLPGTRDLEKGRDQVSGQIGTGEGRIYIGTVDGNVTLRESR
ncbi:MAG: DUF4097 family beta strand repeat protein [Candidatus Zixiibacteriota bacterium]|nr:MAG: DUF4097 family beta strand repeat protein [candidate division Zixibacteria bacterium]